MYFSRIGRLLRRLDVVALLLAIALGSLLGTVYWQQQALETSISEQTLASDAAEAEVKDINRLVETIGQHAQEHVPTSNHIPEMMRAMPESVTLTAISISSETKAMTLEGNTVSRTALLEFQKKLEGLSWVERVESPLQNLASGSNGAFRLSIYAKSPTL